MGEFGEDGVGVYVAFAGEWESATSSDVVEGFIGRIFCSEVFLVKVWVCFLEFFD